MRPDEAFPDYYAILGVPPSASLEEIKKAYRAIVRKVHPDVLPGAGTAMLFRLVHEAYTVLSDPERRAEYDRLREARWGSPEALVQAEVLLSRPALPALAAPQVLYVLLTLQPARPAAGPRPPLHLCLVIDRSNSMKGPRLEQAKAAAMELADHLEPEDRLGVVAFHDRAEVIWPMSPPAERHRLRACLDAVTAEGGTEIYHGLATGLNELLRAQRPGARAHLILLTDGRTYGDEAQCLALADRARAAGIGISAFGIGEDWNDALLDQLAARGGGISGYIAAPEEIRRRFLEHLALLQDRFAEEVRMGLEPAERVLLTGLYQVAPDLRIPPREEGEWYLGPMPGATPLQVLMEFALPPLEPGLLEIATLDFHIYLTRDPPRVERLRRVLQASVLPEEPLTVTPPAPLLEALSRVVLYRMQDQAWAALQAGRREESARRLQQLGTRLLEQGAWELGREALEIATRLLHGQPVPRSRQLALKYGTRMRMLPPPPKGGEA